MPTTTHESRDDGGPAIKVGDIVTWREKVAPGSAITPLGVTGCRVVELGQSEDGRPAALIEALGVVVGALVADLEIEAHT